MYNGLKTLSQSTPHFKFDELCLIHRNTPMRAPFVLSPQVLI